MYDKICLMFEIFCYHNDILKPLCFHILSTLLQVLMRSLVEKNSKLPVQRTVLSSEILDTLDNVLSYFKWLCILPFFSPQESFSTSVQLHLVHHAPCNVPPYVSKNESSLGDLLLGFLKYYATEFE